MYCVPWGLHKNANLVPRVLWLFGQELYASLCLASKGETEHYNPRGNLLAHRRGPQTTQLGTHWKRSFI